MGKQERAWGVWTKDLSVGRGCWGTGTGTGEVWNRSWVSLNRHAFGWISGCYQPDDSLAMVRHCTAQTAMMEMSNAQPLFGFFLTVWAHRFAAVLPAYISVCVCVCVCAFVYVCVHVLYVSVRARVCVVCVCSN